MWWRLFCFYQKLRLRLGVEHSQVPCILHLLPRIHFEFRTKSLWLRQLADTLSNLDSKLLQSLYTLGTSLFLYITLTKFFHHTTPPFLHVASFDSAELQNDRKYFFSMCFYCFQCCDSMILIKASSSDTQMLLGFWFLVKLECLKPFRWWAFMGMGVSCNPTASLWV